MPENLTARVIVKREDGRSILDNDESITTTNVENFAVPNVRLQEAAAEFRDLGFKVEAEGPDGISITATREIFTSFFGENLEPQTDTGSIAIPNSIEDLVAAVIWPSKPELFP